MTTIKTSYHHGNLHATLLATAQDMLEADGAATLSLRAVAKRAGVSHAAPYRHFANKSALLEAIAAQGFAALETAIADAATRFPDDPERQIVECGSAYVREAVARPQRTHLMFGGQLDTDALDRAARSSFDALIEVVRRGRRAGIFEPAATRDTVLAVWSAAHGLAMLIIGQQLQFLDLEPDIPRLLRAVLETRLRPVRQ